MAAEATDPTNWLEGAFDQYEKIQDSEIDGDRELVSGFGNAQLCFLLQ
jgi:hypothetical protein